MRGDRHRATGGKGVIRFDFIAVQEPVKPAQDKQRHQATDQDHLAPGGCFLGLFLLVPSVLCGLSVFSCLAFVRGHLLPSSSLLLQPLILSSTH